MPQPPPDAMISDSPAERLLASANCSEARPRFRTIVADPPWPIRWSGGAAWRTNGRGERHLNKRFKKALDYPTMPVKEICALDVGALAEEDAALWLWTTDRFALEGAAAAVARAWGFEPLRFLVWQKTGIGLGNCPRAAHELCLVCTRGKSVFTRKDVGSVQLWKLVYENGARKHSAKPGGFFDLVMTCSPGPYLELFARSQRLGWASWGNECQNHVKLVPQNDQALRPAQTTHDSSHAKDQS